MHLYKLIEPFLNEPLEIANNFLMSRKDGNYHFLLFNKINDRYLSDSQQRYVFKNTLSTNSLIIIKTLNHEHGAIQNLLPQTKQQFYIERSILDELDKSNQPKTELAIQHDHHLPFQVTLNTMKSNIFVLNLLKNHHKVVSFKLCVIRIYTIIRR